MVMITIYHGGVVVRRRCRGILGIGAICWFKVGQGPALHWVVAFRDCLDVFLSSVLSFLLFLFFISLNFITMFLLHVILVTGQRAQYMNSFHVLFKLYR